MISKHSLLCSRKKLIVEVVLFLDMNKNALKALKTRLLGDKYEVNFEQCNGKTWAV